MVDHFLRRFRHQPPSPVISGKRVSDFFHPQILIFLFLVCPGFMDAQGPDCFPVFLIHNCKHLFSGNEERKYFLCFLKRDGASRPSLPLPERRRIQENSRSLSCQARSTNLSVSRFFTEIFTSIVLFRSRFILNLHYPNIIFVGFKTFSDLIL